MKPRLNKSHEALLKLLKAHGDELTYVITRVRNAGREILLRPGQNQYTFRERKYVIPEREYVTSVSINIKYFFSLHGDTRSILMNAGNGKEHTRSFISRLCLFLAKRVFQSEINRFTSTETISDHSSACFAPKSYAQLEVLSKNSHFMSNFFFK